jgi:AraC family transcriptional regulator
MGTAIPNRERAERLAGHNAICGTNVELLVSSRPFAWSGIVVEVFRAREVDVAAEYSEHVVSVQLRGPINLYQRRSGRGIQRTMHPGDVIITPAGDPKVLRHQEEVEVVKLRVAPSFISRIVEEMQPRQASKIELLDNFGTRDLDIEGIARRLLAELKAAGFASRMYVESLANQLAIHLLRCYSSAKKLPEDLPTRLPRYKLQRATDFINDNLREDLTLERISEALSMSPYHFAHLFKQSMGLAPHRYIIERRMERAKSLLRETELSIKQIGHQVGYSQQSHFSVVFHRFTGQTPHRYRSES